MNYLDFKKKLLYYYYFANYNLIEATNEIIFRFELKPEFLESTSLESVVDVSVKVDSLLEPREIQSLQVEGHITSITINASLDPWQSQDLSLEALIKFISSDSLTSYSSSDLEMWGNNLVSIEIDLNSYLSEALKLDWDTVLKIPTTELQNLSPQDLESISKIILSTLYPLLGLDTSKLEVTAEMRDKIEGIIQALQSIQLKIANNPKLSVVLDSFLSDWDSADLVSTNIISIPIDVDLESLILNHLHSSSELYLKIESFLHSLNSSELKAFLGICLMKLGLLSAYTAGDLSANFSFNKLTYLLDLVLRLAQTLQTNVGFLMQFKETLSLYETSQLLLEAKIKEKSEGILNQYSSSDLSNIFDLIVKTDGKLDSQTSSDLFVDAKILLQSKNALAQYDPSDLKNLAAFVLNLEAQLSSYSSQGLVGDLKACFSLLDSFLTTASSTALKTEPSFKFLTKSKLIGLLSNSLTSQSDNSLILNTDMSFLEGLAFDFLASWSLNISSILNSLESNLLNQNLNAKLNVAADLIALPAGDIYISYYDNDEATLSRISFKESWERDITEFLRGLY